MAKGSTQATYSISDLARAFDVTTRTIRHYEDQGLIAPAVASSVFLTTVTDIVGFFAFLGMAALLLL